jgi:hypothetical protein
MVVGMIASGRVIVMWRWGVREGAIEVYEWMEVVGQGACGGDGLWNASYCSMYFKRPVQIPRNMPVSAKDRLTWHRCSRQGRTWTRHNATIHIQNTDQCIFGFTFPRVLSCTQAGRDLAFREDS